MEEIERKELSVKSRALHIEINPEDSWLVEESDKG